MNNKEVLHITESFVKNVHKDESSGHDYAHIERVRKMAVEIAVKENADLFIVEMAALLHDTVDEKLFDTIAAWERLNKFYEEIQLPIEHRQAINHILKYMSFNGGKNEGKLESLEGKVVQDADRLDALGAIGIARTFMFAGKFGEAMYDPNIPVRDDLSDYRTPSTAINHFYEKLFKLIDLMNTETAKKMAEERNTYMKAFIEQFKKEWC
ncbi:HD domain-containing protein [Macrococcoides goetzii]|uniref:HD domain-containing protein n=1 Tax=Macrococcoides goetzii TaxID=1891097 RepID=A0A395G754_9STAP|nr:HD domain-containing protein [Macrococcus goetzii]RAI79842.1 HD domain-containing protein [Macrococcus goetzii]